MFLLARRLPRGARIRWNQRVGFANASDAWKAVVVGRTGLRSSEEVPSTKSVEAVPREAQGARSRHAFNLAFNFAAVGL